MVLGAATVSGAAADGPEEEEAAEAIGGTRTGAAAPIGKLTAAGPGDGIAGVEGELPPGGESLKTCVSSLVTRLRRRSLRGVTVMESEVLPAPAFVAPCAVRAGLAAAGRASIARVAAGTRLAATGATSVTSVAVCTGLEVAAKAGIGKEAAIEPGARGA